MPPRRRRRKTRRRRADHGDELQGAGRRVSAHQLEGPGHLAFGAEDPGPAGDPGGHSRRRLLRDRKSTRLNSSHSQISYAVFCLKKKKKIIVAAVEQTHWF